MTHHPSPAPPLADGVPFLALARAPDAGRRRRAPSPLNGTRRPVHRVYRSSARTMWHVVSDGE
ncbi:hypothetical protein QF030_002759 [Streptomyces rishiriensis]|uniref:Uncharacterized protein n=1 Tax=Streptomyces rishiriensis TaxID=68264 RepID=A0ABU0NN79_STRRH|nr:hypothetical protein [Streptomyces rishiriensis]